MDDKGLQTATAYDYKRPGQLHMTARDGQGRPKINEGHVIHKYAYINERFKGSSSFCCEEQ